MFHLLSFSFVFSLLLLSFAFVLLLPCCLDVFYVVSSYCLIALLHCVACCFVTLFARCTTLLCCFSTSLPYLTTLPCCHHVLPSFTALKYLLSPPHLLFRCFVALMPYWLVLPFSFARSLELKEFIYLFFLIFFSA